MTAFQITQLLLMFGPQGITLIEQLIANWGKPSLSRDEVLGITNLAKKTYDEYVLAAKAALSPAPVTP